ncbi:MAG: hypothetical protein QOF83_1208 [Solirubrobacteraceae bacterium]|nr:hypothetical protein [Solirubrobacteraceae bacterium]
MWRMLTARAKNRDGDCHLSRGSASLESGCVYLTMRKAALAEREAPPPLGVRPDRGWVTVKRTLAAWLSVKVTFVPYLRRRDAWALGPLGERRGDRQLDRAVGNVEPAWTRARQRAVGLESDCRAAAEACALVTPGRPLVPVGWAPA